jgi:hypothetical protein
MALQPPTKAERQRLLSMGYTEDDLDREFGKAPEGSSLGQKAVGVAREALGQGAFLGFGEEAEGAVRAALRGKPIAGYAEERDKVRREMEEFRRTNRGLAIGSQLAGGFLTPIPGAGARSLAGTALRSAATGAVAGLGAAEGTAGRQATSALMGAATGGALGTALAGGARALAARAQRGGRGVAPSVAGVARRAAEAGIEEPAELATRAQALTADVPQAQVVDVLGAPAVKRMQTIRALGGKAGQQVEEAMAERMEEKPNRLLDALRRTTGRSREDIAETIDESIQRGKQAADPLYAKFQEEPARPSAVVDRILETPFGSTVMERARRNAANEQRRFIEPAREPVMGQLFDASGNPIPITMRPGKAAEYHPRTVDDVKKAMDDLIYETRFANVEAGQGGIRPGEKRAASKLRSQFVEAADEMFPSYAEAREAWAGEKALRDALESGVEAGTKRVSAQEAAREVAELGSSELEYFQRGYLDGIANKIDRGELRIAAVRTKAFKDMLSSVFQSDAPKIHAAIKGELEMVERAGKILGGSQTADKLARAAEDVAPSRLARAAQMVTSPVRTTAVQALGSLERSLMSPRMDIRRGMEAEGYLTPARDIGSLIKRMEDELKIQRRAGAAGQRVGVGGAKAAGIGVGRLFRPPQENE